MTMEEREIFFICDVTRLSQEKDFIGDAILYFTPKTLPEETHNLVGHIVAINGFFKQFTTDTSGVSIISLQNMKISVQHVENYTMGLSGHITCSDELVRDRLLFLIDMFRFYHGSFTLFSQKCQDTGKDIKTELTIVWDWYISYIQGGGETVQAGLNGRPVLNISPEANTRVYEMCSHYLEEACSSVTGLRAGCIMYKNKLLCSHLSIELTTRLCVLRPKELQVPVELAVDLNNVLPQGVYIYKIFLTPAEHESLTKFDWSVRNGERRTSNELNHSMQNADQTAPDSRNLSVHSANRKSSSSADLLVGKASNSAGNLVDKVVQKVSSLGDFLTGRGDQKPSNSGNRMNGSINQKATQPQKILMGNGNGKTSGSADLLPQDCNQKPSSSTSLLVENYPKSSNSVDGAAEKVSDLKEPSMASIPDLVKDVRAAEGVISEADHSSLEAVAQNCEHSNTEACGRSDLIEMDVYVQSNSSMILILMMDKGVGQSKQAIINIWKHSLKHMADIETAIILPEETVAVVDKLLRQPSDSGSARRYIYLSYDETERTLTGDTLSPVTVDEVDFYNTALTMNQRFLVSSEIFEIFLRRQDSVYGGVRMFDRQLFCYRPHYADQSAGPAVRILNVKKMQDLLSAIINGTV